MTKKFHIRSILFTLFLFILTCSGTSEAVVTPPWSTTFNCNAWTLADGDTEAALNCDGMVPWGSWTCSPGAVEEQVTVAANNPNNTNGVGSKGQRDWIGDGTNNGSGGLSVFFDQPYSELWVRWYMKFPKGFKWNPMQYHKILFFNVGKLGAFYVGWAGGDDFRFSPFYGGGGDLYCPQKNCGWNTVMGGSGADGQWHYYETHVKAETNGANGVAEQWIDGKKIISYNNVNFGFATPGWTFIDIAANHNSPANGGCVPVDFDDIAISTTGYIGPLSDTLFPGSPTPN